MRRGEIWRVALDPALGVEQQGVRPVLIISPDIFNNVTRCPIVLPITNGGNFARMRGFAVSLEGQGLETTGVVRCDQPRALDIGQRRGTRVEAVPDELVRDVLARVSALIG